MLFFDRVETLFESSNAILTRELINQIFLELLFLLFLFVRRRIFLIFSTFQEIFVIIKKLRITGYFQFKCFN